MAKKKTASTAASPKPSKAKKPTPDTPRPGSVAAGAVRVDVGAFHLGTVSRPTMPGACFVVCPFDMEGDGLAFETQAQAEECLGDVARRRGFDHAGPLALPPEPAEGT